MKVIKVKAKKAFTPTKIPGADYVINQYIGCQYACKYCYAKFIRKWYNYGEWGRWVIVKENLPELVKDKKVKGSVYMSSLSDPYQQIEKEIKLTRRILKNMDKNIDLSILSKSNMVLRDIDIFKKFNNLKVGLTINGLEENLKREIEPFSSSNKERIEALKKLYENKIKTYVFISPIIPGLVNIEKLINKTKSFVNFYWFEFLNLRASGREFIIWLKQNYPENYKVLLDKEKSEKELKKIKDLIREKGIKSRGIYLHYPS